jgi:hypothetical protein
MPRLPSRYVLCVRNGTYRFSLQPRKVYRVLSDSTADRHGLVRVIDESGEDYLFPANLFVPIEVPARGKPAFVRARASRLARPARKSGRSTRS